MTAQLGAIVVDAADPSALARFWHRMLGAAMLAQLPGWVVLVDPEGSEFCAFPDPQGAGTGAAGRLFSICTDSVRVDDERLTPNRWRWTLRADHDRVAAERVDPQGNGFELY